MTTTSAPETAPVEGTDSPGSEGTEVRFHHSELFPHVLEEAGCSLLVSTYQAGQIVGVGVADGRLNFSFRRFDRAMGIEPAGRYDRCWLPRSSTVTGEIQCHEVAWGTTEAGEPELWVVNTLFSCLAGLDSRYSFVPRWRPPFISELAAQDRCHLNGLAMRDGSPAYVTVMACTDEPRGWRALRNDSGTVLDVASGDAVTTGLAMPHSPRWYDGNLFVLNSGMGRLERVDLATGQRDPVAAVPGYARGLAIHRGLAFVGLSTIRETAIFGGAPIAAHHDELKCGVGIIELASGNTVATLQFATGVEEIFDVQVCAQTRCPTFGGLPGDSDEIWLLPDQREPAGVGR